MPATPITIPVAPSRASWCSQFLLATLVVAAVLHAGPGWLVLPALIWLVVLSGWLWWRQPQGELQVQLEADGTQRWLWRPAAAKQAQPFELRCFYLGPWLVGLAVNRRRLWLWPDSVPPGALRQLRRALLQQSASITPTR